MKKFCLLVVLLFIGCSITALAQKVEWALVDTKTTAPFHDGRAFFKEKVRGKELYGCIDRSGNVVIPPRYKKKTSIDDFKFDGGFAIVTDIKGKKGIIDRQGNYVLEPVYDGIWKREYEYGSRCYCQYVDGLYNVFAKGKRGIFYNNQMIGSVEYKTVSNYFPFISATKNKKESKVFNILTGEEFDKVFFSDNIYTVKKGDKVMYFDINGNDVNSLSVSSKGVTTFQDNVSKKYGFKNIETGAVIVPPIYHDIKIPLWVDDVMIVTYKEGEKYTNALIDISGKEIIERGKFGISLIDQNFVRVYYNGSWGLYTTTGKEVLPTEYSSISAMGNGLFRIGIGENFLYNANTGKMYQGYKVDVCPHDGMYSFSFQWKKGYINAETGEIIPARYDNANNFSEGVALVEKDGKKYLIDKNENIVLEENDQFSFQGYGVSEGVIGAYDKIKGTYGYIYNPYKKEGNGQSPDADAPEKMIARWMKEGHEEFEKANYGAAMEYYYKVMMNEPKNVNAIINYGASLGNIGYYDEAIEACLIALDIEPENKIATENLAILQNSKKMQEESAQQQAQQQETSYEPQRSSTFWDALGTFVNVLNSMYGSTTTTNYGGNGTYPTGTAGTITRETTTTGRGAAYYQNLYSMWERRAEANYRSLTNLGVSFKEKNTGERAGSTLQSMSGSNYVSMKRCLREAQREMQKYRRQAAQEGITIPQSTWETATVSY